MQKHASLLNKIQDTTVQYNMLQIQFTIKLFFIYSWTYFILTTLITHINVYNLTISYFPFSLSQTFSFLFSLLYLRLLLYAHIIYSSPYQLVFHNDHLVKMSIWSGGALLRPNKYSIVLTILWYSIYSIHILKKFLSQSFYFGHFNKQCKRESLLLQNWHFSASLTFHLKK